MAPFLTIEQKVECLAQAVGEVKQQLHRFLAVTNASLPTGLLEARKIIEYLIGRVLLQEGLEADRELLNNIEILGGKEGKFPVRRRKDLSAPIPPPILPTPLYSSMHNLRIYGNLVAHPWDPQTMELKDVRLTTTDLQVALGQIMRLLEWYFQEYPRGPRLDPLYDQLPEPVVARYGEVPPDPASFLGRTGELARLRRVLADGPARLVTVLAPAGMGKTLIAARAALDVAGRWQDGRGSLLWFDLRAAPSFGEVSARILASLQPGSRPADLAIVQLSPGARVGQIVRGLADQPVLLVLDNFESWLDPSTRAPLDPAVGQLLEQAATRAHRGRVLLTSRLAVELSGVPVAALATLPLSPLPLPEARELLLREGVGGSERAVAEVERRLGGNPRLLIMLAEVLLRRRCRDLDDGLERFPGLVSRAAEGLLTEVWGELPEAARLVLQTLAVLRPPVPVADLAGVLAQLTADAVLSVEDILWDDLIPRALVVPTEDGTAFGFEHLLIRDHALQRWLDPGVAHRAALRYYQGILAARPEGSPLHPAHFAVIHYALAIDDHALAARILTSDVVRRQLLRQGRHTELLELCRPILVAVERLEPLLRLTVRRLAGNCLDNLGDYPGALDLLEACRRELAEWRETHEGCWTLTELCSVLRKLQRYEAAEAAAREALAVARRQNLPDSEAWALFELGHLERNRGRPAESARLAKAGLELADRVNDPILPMMGRIARARTLVSGSNLGRARQLYEEALDLTRRLGHVRTEAQVLQSLADIARRQTRNDEAMRQVNEAIDIFQQIGDRTGEGIARHCRGLLLYQMGKAHAPEALAELRRAVRLAFDLEHRREVASVLTSLAKVYYTPATAGVCAACWQTAQDLHTGMGHDTWKEARRGLDELREHLAATGVGWRELEQIIAIQRPALLAEATLLDQAAWQRFLITPNQPLQSTGPA
jgi:tetratricopeptide (TPR) repeat protein